MSAIRIAPVTDFNLAHTLECGQSFRWRAIDEWYYGVVDGRLLRVRQEDRTVVVESSDDDAAEELSAFCRRYFDLNRDLPAILKAVDTDPYIHHAIQAYWGMRILNQDLWECIGSFVLSQNNNVPRIKGIIRTISAQYGRRVALNGQVDYTFPTPHALVEAGVDGLHSCRMGYRAPYLWDISSAVTAGALDLEMLKGMPHNEARQTLMRFRGIGEKVADCICLFALGHMEALPIDVWIKRIIEQIYLKRRASIREIRAFTQNYFGEHMGYAQQYLFHYARTVGLEEMKALGENGRQG